MSVGGGVEAALRGGGWVEGAGQRQDCQDEHRVEGSRRVGVVVLISISV